jgi:putative ribosome biogenesis GTPase RsgA
VQHLSNQFWDRWKKEYLPLLQPRKKWHQGKQNLKVGDIVHMRDVALHRNQWPMGIVTKCYPSSDSLVRKVDIKLGSTRKIMTRPVQEIVLVLPKSDPPADEPIV